MNGTYVDTVARELSLQPRQVMACAALLEEDATVPFIARYRKEATGSLDEVQIASIRDRLEELAELEKRRESILKLLASRELLTDELHTRIMEAATLPALEDIYLPYRPKRRTRATVAREKGLEPLAEIVFRQDPHVDPNAEAAAFVDEEKGVPSPEEALEGARDIIAEWVSEHQEARATLRALYEQKGAFHSKVIAGKETEGAKYRDYFDWEEPVATAPSHRILAIRRGEKEEVLTLSLSVPEGEALGLIEAVCVKGESASAAQVRSAVQDSFRRLLSFSMATELRLATKERADKEAIRVFAENLRELLLAPPLGSKNVLAVDPGIRTGCKVCCLDRQGKLVEHATMYPFGSERSAAQAGATIRDLCERCEIEAIAVGNGTAGRETERFLHGLGLPKTIPVLMVNESGASVYSASEVARAEFPELDVTVRGAVSIGRRLGDPLAELVKIDPKSIGVGQYQHDVNQQGLKRNLDDVVISCVNAVGVDVNTASEQLLTYVSGVGPALAKSIIAYRNAHGRFEARETLMQVPRLGPKAFEQAAGFLRVQNGSNPLDASAVHPESYPVVEAMARDLGGTVQDLLAQRELREKIELSRYQSERIGMPTLIDIMSELAKPGRDPRKQFETFSFAEGVNTLEDLQPGMRLPGVVTNVTAFGAFVDIGVHQDGLVHVSELADRFVTDPHQVVKVHQQVMVNVVEVDLERRRIALSLRQDREKAKKKSSAGPFGRDNASPKAEKHGGYDPHNPFVRAFLKKN